MTKTEARNITIGCIHEASKIVNAKTDDDIYIEAINHWEEGYESFEELFGKCNINDLQKDYEQRQQIRWFMIGAGLISA